MNAELSLPVIPTPDVGLVSNSCYRGTPKIHRWLAGNPRFHPHFTPTYSSWLNLVERWFAELTNKWLRRGTQRSTKELEAAISSRVATWNEDPKPFIWHKSPDEIPEPASHLSLLPGLGALAGC